MGKLDIAEIIEPKAEEPRQNKPGPEVDEVRQMMDSSPNEFTEPQREQVRELLQENEAVFPKGSMILAEHHSLNIPNRHRYTSSRSATPPATSVQIP